MNGPNAPNNPPPACVQALSHFHAFLTYQPGGQDQEDAGFDDLERPEAAAGLITLTAVALLRRDA